MLLGCRECSATYIAEQDQLSHVPTTAINIFENDDNDDFKFSNILLRRMKLNEYVLNLV